MTENMNDSVSQVFLFPPWKLTCNFKSGRTELNNFCFSNKISFICLLTKQSKEHAGLFLLSCLGSEVQYRNSQQGTPVGLICTLCHNRAKQLHTLYSELVWILNQNSSVILDLHIFQLCISLHSSELPTLEG